MSSETFTVVMLNGHVLIITYICIHTQTAT